MTSWSPRERMDVFRSWLKGSLSLIHLHVLTVIEADGPLPMSRLAESLDVSVASATGIVGRMEERGLVERRHAETRPAGRRRPPDRDRRGDLPRHDEPGAGSSSRSSSRRLTDDELTALLTGLRAIRASTGCPARGRVGRGRDASAEPASPRPQRPPAPRSDRLDRAAARPTSRPYRGRPGRRHGPPARPGDRQPLPAGPQRRHHQQRRRHAATSDYILRTGGLMLVITAAPRRRGDRGVYLSARVAIGLRPRRPERDLRRGRDVRPGRGQPVRPGVADHAQHERRPAGPDRSCSWA